MKKFKLNTLLYLAISIGVLSGCQSWYGPENLNDTHAAYNHAIVNSLSQEMLLNLVRLKYRDRPYFLNINSVTASMSIRSSLGLGTSTTIAGSSSVSPEMGISFTQSPTISYAPLGGEDFLKSLLSPIPIEAVLVMAQSGWRAERIFGLCIERINNLSNAASASGPTPAMQPEYQLFQEFLAAFHYLQSKRVIEFGISLDSSKHIEVRFLETNDKQAKLAIKKIQRLLTIQPSHRYQLSTNFIENNPKYWNIRLRSISSLLHYLSQNINVPVLHQQQGLVTSTINEKGVIFNWDKTPAGELFKIQSSDEKPENAYLKVFYREHWFYIADNDLNSKSTFMLLTQLFNLQAGQQKAVNPTLTIPVGNQ